MGQIKFLILTISVTCFMQTSAFLLDGTILNQYGGYAMYVWRDGYDPEEPGCSINEFLSWNKHSHCFTHTWNTATKRQWLWSTCNVTGRKIRKIFLADVHHSLRDGYNSKNCNTDGIHLLKQTLGEGHVQVSGIQIYALFAVSDIDVSEKDMVKYVLWYNDICAGGTQKFDGVAVNNEAYAGIKCNAGNTEQLAYLQNLNKISTEAAKQVHGRLLTHYSISWHWGRCHGTQNMMTYNGKSQDAAHHMIDMFDSIDIQVGYIIFPQISDRAKLAGYQHALDSRKEVYVTLYTNKGDLCQTTFFPSSCSKGNHTEAGMFSVFDDFGKYGIGKAQPCIHYFRGIYSSGGNTDWPKH